jgi:hypothetical protein
VLVGLQGALASLGFCLGETSEGAVLDGWQVVQHPPPPLSIRNKVLSAAGASQCLQPQLCDIGEAPEGSKRASGVAASS